MTAWVGLAATMAAFGVSACGGDTSSPNENSGGGGTGGSMTSNGGTPDATGGSMMGSGGTPMAMGGMDATGGTDGMADCPAIPNSNITDFTLYDAAGNWGNPATDLTGSTFLYPTATEPDFMAQVDDNDVMNLTGQITTFAGFGLAFGPSCNDASAFTGLRFTLGGTTTVVGDDTGGGALLEVQIQSRENTPEPPTSRGVCVGTFSTCINNRVVIDELTPAGATVELPFSEFTGGAPSATLNEAEILAIQWQFGCSSDGSLTCDLAVTLDDVEFY